ncbi:hypothetical protein BKK52_01090 [Rodentibacter trehalosifermentans]|uniref:DUF1640 domain-containing protein n=1 Tax=Rodentibacter trehalosifermentans TaxID=1908263 RepID=A0A1V3J7A7_9PAST|nr:hypothetical protein [Rodentibacter trehalosifermentans]OOF50774.1 hypothetical protein BKK52_01090 [Rodentibacter trehalosifermentans]
MGNAMATIRFDKLRFVKKLTEGGQSQEQAEILAEALDGALEQSQATLVTKQDILILEQKLQREILTMKQELTAEFNTSIYKMAGLIIAGVGLLMTLVKFFN